MSSDFAFRIKKLREGQGFSVKDVAAKLAVSVSTYREWEYGRQISRHQALVDLAQLYHVSLRFLMTGETTNYDEEKNRILESLDILQQQLNAHKQRIQSFFEDERRAR